MSPPASTPDNLPAVTVVEITDPTAVNAGIELLDQEAVQLQSMPLRARRVIVRLDPATVVFHSSNLRVRTRTSVHSGLVAYVAFGPDAQGTVNGLPVRPGLLLCAESESEAAFVVEPGWQSITFLLPPESLREHLAARQRDAEFRQPRGVEPVRADPEKVRGLFAWGKRLVDIAERQPELFNEHVRQRSAAQVEMLENLLATLGGADEYDPTRDDLSRQAHGLLVKMVEDYVRSRAADDLHVSDLCRAASASERTLQYAFREVLGLTPMGYLTRLRLHRVREGLVAGNRGTTTVSAEALRWGFWHFGDFSRAYRECFGELPSDTLARSPGAAQE